MLVKDKKLLERGFKLLEEKLGTDKNEAFFQLIASENLDYARLKEICDALEEERRKKAEAAEAAKPPKPPVYSESEFNAILADYMSYLQNLKIECHNHQGFTVWMPKDDKPDYRLVEVGKSWDGGLSVRCYVGRALSDKVRPVNSLAKAIEKKFPEYRVYTETYHHYSHEIELIDNFAYTTIEELHQHVVRMNEAAKQVCGMGNEVFGKNFEAQ